MNRKENARPVAGTTERAAETAAYCRAAISCDQCNMAAAGRQLKIADYLSTGAENGQTIADLERLTGQRSREIRKRIEAERRAGALIISDNKNGYYLADDSSEARRFARSMQHRAAEILKTAKAVEKAAGC